MSASDATPAKYDLARVEGVILEESICLHPHRPTTSELCLEIVNDADDRKELKIATEAIHSLKDVGLFHDRDDDIVELTPAALRAGTLLMH